MTRVVGVTGLWLWGSVCGAELPAEKPNATTYCCPAHEHGVLDLKLDYDLIKKRIQEEHDSASLLPLDQFGIWRYRAMLPLPYMPSSPKTPFIPPLGLLVGCTPLTSAPATLVSELNLKELWFKDDGRNPTGSLKDRASALIVAKAQSEKREIISTASTGNAAAALAGMCASANQKCVIFVPYTAPEAKQTQLVMYGADVVLVKGTYDDAFDLCLSACKKFGWYCRNTGYNPFTSEGKKTVSFEICEQLWRRHHTPNGDEMKFETPDLIFVSVGDGNIVSGVHTGFKNLLALGYIDKLPKIIGVQSTGSRAVAEAWSSRVDLKTDPDDMKLTPISCDTLADSISAGLPRDPIRAARAARGTEGQYVQVADTEILVAMRELARATGIFSEPAAACAYAGLLKLSKEQPLLCAGKTAVVLLTGNGLKDIANAKKAVAVDLSKVSLVPPGGIEAVEKLFPPRQDVPATAPAKRSTPKNKNKNKNKKATPSTNETQQAQQKRAPSPLSTTQPASKKPHKKT
ncbi:threonine synthase [Pelomyxa schiedti]|nr:threonine synthase [Pelomyxa schiedti]